MQPVVIGRCMYQYQYVVTIPAEQVLKTGGTQEIDASVKEGMGEEEKEGECDNQEQSEEELTSNLSDQNCNKSTEELQEEDSTGNVSHMYQY